MSIAKHTLEQGAIFPYDGGEDFWKGLKSPPEAKDWAHAAARGVLADLTDRRGIKRELSEVSHEVRAELTESLAEIIRLANTLQGGIAMQRVAGDEAPRPPEKVTEAISKLAEAAHTPPIPPDYYVWLQIYCAAMSNNDGVYSECQLADRGLEKFKRRFPRQ